MGRNIEYDRKWREKNREAVRKYNREYARKRSNKKKNNWSSEIFSGTSGMGRKYELLALRLLPYSIDNNKYSFAGGFDIWYKNKKIEVKVRNKKANRWTFTFKKTCTADYCFLFCLSENRIDVEHILYIPYTGQSYIYVDKLKIKEFGCYNSYRCSLPIE